MIIYDPKNLRVGDRYLFESSWALLEGILVEKQEYGQVCFLKIKWADDGQLSWREAEVFKRFIHLEPIKN